MNVVGGGVGVEDLNGLSGHYAEHMRDVAAAALVDGDRRQGSGKAAIAETVFHVNEYVCKIATIDDEVFRGGEFCAAIGIIGHVDLGCGGNGAFEMNCTGNGGSGGEVDGSDGLGLGLLCWLVAGDESETE